MSHIQGPHVKKLLPCILLMLTVGVSMGQRRVLQKSECLKSEYWTEGLCCHKCPEGYKLTKRCSSGMSTQCAKCSEGTYQDKMNYFPNCFRCQECTKRSHAVMISPCTYQSNTVCGCQSGYRKKMFDSISWACEPFKKSDYV